MLTKREIFDRVKDHLLTQNKQSKSHSQSMCLYYNEEDQTKCALGALINPAYYDKTIEGTVPSDIADVDKASFSDIKNLRERTIKLGESLRLSDVDTEDKEIMTMISRLQGLHDGLSPQFWSERLDVIEKELAIPPAPTKTPEKQRT